MPYFKDQNCGLHYLDDAADAHLLPDGCVGISDADAEAIVAAASLIPFDQVKADLFERVRAAREIVLNRLMGMATAALITSDMATAQSCEAARQSLLNLTADAGVMAATDEASLKSAFIAAYQKIVTAAPANIIGAFDAFNGVTV